MSLILYFGSAYCVIEGSQVIHPTHSAALTTAIAKVESNMNPRAVGKLGERGLFQFRKRTWQATTNLPFDYAFDPVISQGVALEHLNTLSEKFNKATKHMPAIHDLYAMWNVGFYGYKKRGFHVERCPATTRRKILAVQQHYIIILGKN